MTATTAAAAAVPRIAPLQAPYDPETGAQLERWMPPGVAAAGVEPLALFRTLARHGELMSRMRPLGAGILGAAATVPPRLRELMIDRTCALTGAEYEWGVHTAAFGEAVGLDERQLDATAIATAAGAAGEGSWSEQERTVLQLAEELHETSTISEPLWHLLSAHFDERQIIELVVTAGWYHAISYLCNGLRVPLEPWARRFPAQ